MIDALVSGRLYGKPVAREAKNGNSFGTAKVRVSVRDGEAYFVNVIAFAQSAVRPPVAELPRPTVPGSTLF